MITHYIVSDLHLANGTRRDDFKKNRTKFKNFLRMIGKQKAQLIIAGDFLELLQTNPINIVRTYSDILNELISLQAKIVIGNHDYYLHHFRKLNFPYDSYQNPVKKSL
jgi:UDP-2,3-diacylglucosamine pyrophosphatase LpxH